MQSATNLELSFNPPLPKLQSLHTLNTIVGSPSHLIVNNNQMSIAKSPMFSQSPTMASFHPKIRQQRNHFIRTDSNQENVNQFNASGNQGNSPGRTAGTMGIGQAPGYPAEGTLNILSRSTSNEFKIGPKASDFGSTEQVQTQLQNNQQNTKMNSNRIQSKINRDLRKTSKALGWRPLTSKNQRSRQHTQFMNFGQPTKSGRQSCDSVTYIDNKNYIEDKSAQQTIETELNLIQNLLYLMPKHFEHPDQVKYKTLQGRFFSQHDKTRMNQLLMKNSASNHKLNQILKTTQLQHQLEQSIVNSSNRLNKIPRMARHQSNSNIIDTYNNRLIKHQTSLKFNPSQIIIDTDNRNLDDTDQKRNKQARQLALTYQISTNRIKPAAISDDLQEPHQENIEQENEAAAITNQDPTVNKALLTSNFVQETQQQRIIDQESLLQPQQMEQLYQNLQNQQNQEKYQTLPAQGSLEPMKIQSENIQIQTIKGNQDIMMSDGVKQSARMVSTVMGDNATQGKESDLTLKQKTLGSIPVRSPKKVLGPKDQQHKSEMLQSDAKQSIVQQNESGAKTNCVVSVENLNDSNMKPKMETVNPQRVAGSQEFKPNTIGGAFNGLGSNEEILQQQQTAIRDPGEAQVNENGGTSPMPVNQNDSCVDQYSPSEPMTGPKDVQTLEKNEDEITVKNPNHYSSTHKDEEGKHDLKFSDGVSRLQKTQLGHFGPNYEVTMASNVTNSMLENRRIENGAGAADAISSQVVPNIISEPAVFTLYHHFNNLKEAEKEEKLETQLTLGSDKHDVTEAENEKEQRRAMQQMVKAQEQSNNRNQRCMRGAKLVDQRQKLQANKHKSINNRNSQQLIAKTFTINQPANFSQSNQRATHRRLTNHYEPDGLARKSTSNVGLVKNPTSLCNLPRTRRIKGNRRRQQPWMPSDKVAREDFEKIMSEINSLNMGSIGMGDEQQVTKFRQEMLQECTYHHIDKIDDRKTLKLGNTERIQKFVPDYDKLKNSFKPTEGPGSVQAQRMTQYNNDLQNLTGALVDAQNVHLLQQANLANFNLDDFHQRKQITFNMNQLRQEQFQQTWLTQKRHSPGRSTTPQSPDERQGSKTMSTQCRQRSKSRASNLSFKKSCQLENKKIKLVDEGNQSDDSNGQQFGNGEQMQGVQTADRHERTAVQSRLNRALEHAVDTDRNKNQHNKGGSGLVESPRSLRRGSGISKDNLDGNDSVESNSPMILKNAKMSMTKKEVYASFQPAGNPSRFENTLKSNSKDQTTGRLSQDINYLGQNYQIQTSQQPGQLKSRKKKGDQFSIKLNKNQILSSANLTVQSSKKFKNFVGNSFSSSTGHGTKQNPTYRISTQTFLQKETERMNQAAEQLEKTSHHLKVQIGKERAHHKITSQNYVTQMQNGSLQIPFPPPSQNTSALFNQFAEYQVMQNPAFLQQSQTPSNRQANQSMKSGKSSAKRDFRFIQLPVQNLKFEGPNDQEQMKKVKDLNVLQYYTNQQGHKAQHVRRRLQTAIPRRASAAQTKGMTNIQSGEYQGTSPSTTPFSSQNIWKPREASPKDQKKLSSTQSQQRLTEVQSLIMTPLELDPEKLQSAQANQNIYNIANSRRESILLQVAHQRRKIALEDKTNREKEAVALTNNLVRSNLVGAKNVSKMKSMEYRISDATQNTRLEDYDQIPTGEYLEEAHLKIPAPVHGGNVRMSEQSRNYQDMPRQVIMHIDPQNPNHQNNIRPKELKVDKIDTLNVLTINNSADSSLSPHLNAKHSISPSFNQFATPFGGYKSNVDSFSFNNKQLMQVQAVGETIGEQTAQENAYDHNNNTNYSILDQIVNGRYQINQMQIQTMDSNLDDSGLKDMIGQIPRANESGSVGVSIEHKDEYVQRRIYSVVGTNEGDESKTDMDKVEHHFDSSPKDKN